MRKFLFIFLSLLLLALCPVCAQDVPLSKEQAKIMEEEAKLLKQLQQKQAEEQKAVTEDLTKEKETIAQEKAEGEIPNPDLMDVSKIPQEKYDVNAILPVPDNNPQKDVPASDFAAVETDLPLGTPPTQTEGDSNLPPEQTPEPAAAPAKQKQGFALVANSEDLDDLSPIPPGTLAVYIDIEEAFNKNPWTLQARKNIKLELETKQLEFVQLKEQLQELTLKEKNLLEEIKYYSPFYSKSKYVATGDNQFPKIQDDILPEILNKITFGGVEPVVSSPENAPAKLASLQKQVKDTRKAIIEKEAFLLNYRELSREEILSRQDYIVQQILKEIYSGIKEYSALRSIGLVVDKKDLVFGTPLNVTPEFVKWMKSYHKKYIKQNGDIL